MSRLSGLLMIILSLFVLVACQVSEADPTDLVEFESNLEYDRLFDDSKKKELIVQISSEAWNALDQSMVDYGRRFGGDLRNDEYVQADLKYVDDDGELLIRRIGLRTRGNLSRVRIQNDDGTLNLSHFKISFKEPFDIEKDSKPYEAITKRKVFGVGEINLKFNRNWDSTYLSEKFSYDLFSAMGLLSPKVALVNFSIQIDETLHFYGIYHAIESIDKDFLIRRLGSPAAQGNLYKCLWGIVGPATLIENRPWNAIGIKDVSVNYRPSYDLKTNKNANDTSDLVDFIHLLNTLEGDDFKQFIENRFEVEDFLKFLAVGVLLGNPDDYRAMGNNYYLYHNNIRGKFTMIPYDYDHSMGQGWDGHPVFTNHTIGADIYRWGNLNEAFGNPRPDSSHPLVDKILAVPEYQHQYEDHLAHLILSENRLFDSIAFMDVYDQQRLLYDEELVDAMLPLRFHPRNVENYINLKRSDIQSQLAYYAQNPSKRGT